MTQLTILFKIIVEGFFVPNIEVILKMIVNFQVFWLRLRIF